MEGIKEYQVVKTLITGGSSLLGKYLLRTAPEGCDVEATWYTNYVGVPMHQMDVCDKSQVAYTFDKVRPDAVIHCAITTKVDSAEYNPEITQRVCVEGTWNIHRAAEKAGAKFIYLSTNAVFDGERPPYAEDAERNPVNLYGTFRKEAEDVMTCGLAGMNWMIVRTFLLYGWPWPGGRKNWATILVDGLGKGRKFTLVDDRYWQPTYALDCAEAVWRLLEAGEAGKTYHVAGSDRLTLHDFGHMVARVFNLDADLLRPVSSDAFPNMAPRPVDSTYDLSKAAVLGIKPRGVVAGLGAMRKEDRGT